MPEADGTARIQTGSSADINRFKDYLGPEDRRQLTDGVPLPLVTEAVVNAVLDLPQADVRKKMAQRAVELSVAGRDIPHPVDTFYSLASGDIDRSTLPLAAYTDGIEKGYLGVFAGVVAGVTGIKDGTTRQQVAWELMGGG